MDSQSGTKASTTEDLLCGLIFLRKQQYKKRTHKDTDLQRTQNCDDLQTENKLVFVLDTIFTFLFF